MAKKETEVEVKINEPKKGETIKVIASYITKDVDGLKTKHVFIGQGKTVAEALDVRNQEDENIIFPQGINLLVNTKVSKGSNVIEKSLAPHKARALFGEKREDVFQAVYRGL